MRDGYSIIKNKMMLINNGSNNNNRDARKIVLDLLEEGIKFACPIKAISEAVKFDGKVLQICNQFERIIDKDSRIFVIGGGKASGTMACALEQLLGNQIEKGLINIPKNLSYQQNELCQIKLNCAEHPVPKEGTIKGTKEILQLLENVTEKDLIICLISGGGSSLLELPLEPITYQELGELFIEITKTGAPVNELNIVRKHLSQLKGGKLAKLAQPATIVSLIISDTTCDRLDVIASGPTAPDPTNWNDVGEILNKYNLWGKLPKTICEIIHKGMIGTIPDTIKEKDQAFQNVFNFIIASNKTIKNKIAQIVKSKKLKPILIENPIKGESKDVGIDIVNRIKSSPNNSILIAGGETTVTIKGNGLGGRNQELVLSAIRRIEESDSIVIASMGTDGIDGPTDAAGAIGDCYSVKRNNELGINVEKYLLDNNAYNYFAKIEDLIITGDTGTNVTDIVIAFKH